MRGDVSAAQRSVQILAPRDVPLGGLRAMNVRRTLPQRQRTLIGPWCFCDHYGPDDLAVREPMVVPPHPHTGLATVSWLFSGEIEHRDSAGNHAMVRPGELNLMTAGRGISHSEYSTPDTLILHGVQLWLALPDDARQIDPHFEHYAPPLVHGSGWQARVFLGTLLDDTSPVRTHSPLLGAEIVIESESRFDLEVDPAFEHGVLVDAGEVVLDGTPLTRGELGYVEAGRPSLRISTVRPTRILLLGGEPFGEQIVMWWNFIGRDHDEVARYREQWESLLATGDQTRFSLADDPLEALHAPVLPNARMRPRG